MGTHFFNSTILIVIVSNIFIERVKIVGGKTKIVSVKGNKITVRCTATGIPKPVFSFFLPRKKAEPESVKTRYLHDGRTGVAEYTFDGGPTELECSAVNDHGFDKVQLQLPKSKKRTFFL